MARCAAPRCDDDCRLRAFRPPPGSLAAQLADADPRILFGGYIRSGARSGEYRFEIGPHRSVYVQAPVTPAGRQRRGWRFWAGGRQCDRWCYALDLGDVADAVRQLAREYWASG